MNIAVCVLVTLVTCSSPGDNGLCKEERDKMILNLQLKFEENLHLQQKVKNLQSTMFLVKYFDLQIYNFFQLSVYNQQGQEHSVQFPP